MRHAHRNPTPTAFTLVELLVVVAVVALLLGLLLPAIGKAIRTAERVGCSSNIRQIATATVLYATDNDDETPPPQHWFQTATRRDRASNLEGPSSYKDGASPMWSFDPLNDGRFVGLLIPYINDQIDPRTELPDGLEGDAIVRPQLQQLECPENDRVGTDGNPLGFDYTPNEHANGLELTTSIRAGMIKQGIAKDTGSAVDIGRLDQSLGDPEAILEPFRDVPFWIEESNELFNTAVPDGRWGNRDQISARHEGEGHIAYLDTSQEMYRPYSGPAGINSEENAEDPQANDLFVGTRRFGWLRTREGYRKYDERTGEPVYGWINRPFPIDE